MFYEKHTCRLPWQNQTVFMCTCECMCPCVREGKWKLTRRRKESHVWNKRDKCVLSVLSCVCVFVLAPIPPLRQRFNKQHNRIKGNRSVYTCVVHIAACLCCTPLVKTDWMAGRKYNKHLISGDGKRKIFHPCFFGWKICFSIIDSSSL